MGFDENKAVVRSWLREGWNKGNVDFADEIIAEDFLVHGAGGQVFPSGSRGVKELVQTWRKAFPDGQMRVLDEIAEGELACVRLLWTGTHLGEFYGVPPSGNKVACASIGIDRVRGGKVVEGWGELDMFGMMQQMGAIPRMGPEAPPDPGARDSTRTLPTSTSIEENKMVALRLIEAINAWDLDAARSVCDTDRYLEHNPAWGSTRFEDMLRAYTLIRASLPDLSFVSNTDLIVGEGDRVVVSGTVVGTHTGAPLFGVPASGKKLEWTGIDIARVTDGRITERWLCADILRLVQQLGLTPGN